MSGSRSGRFAAVDLGASSGRVMVGEVGPDTLTLRAAARFPNDPVRHDDGLHWDVDELHRQVLAGLEAAAAGGELSSIGVDTWAVDYALLCGGRLLGQPFHYRDERRCELGPARVGESVGAEELYRRNGLQHLPFNTLYQLAAERRLSEATSLLLLPDLLNCALTGNRAAERTNASTTGLLGVHTKEWDTDLMVRLGLDVGLFHPLVDPGHIVGRLLPNVAERVGHSIPVVAVGSHDTASAVVGVPMLTDDAAYVSLGTWALAGLELDEPVVTEDARLANFTNEGGVDGTVRFLTNVMGTWLLTETLRAWGEPDLSGMLRAAEAHTGQVPIVDVQDVRFVPPGDMPGRIVAWCTEHDVSAPTSRVAMVRCIVESIAAAIAAALDHAAGLAGRSVDVVHVVGGGAQNAPLCQAIADRSGRPVLAGPVEATALGNVLVQARALGLDLPSLGAMRELVLRTHAPRSFRPRAEISRVTSSNSVTRSWKRGRG
jgi:rhamnulokinase